MNTKKYVSLDKLSLYDEKIKKYLADADAVALQSAKDYADGLAKNYDAAGSAATAESNAKGYTDTEIGKVNSAVAGVKTTAEQGVADAAAAAGAASAAQEAADKAQGEVDALESYVGTFTASEGVDTVVKYIDAKTANIASEETVGALDTRLTQAEKDIDAIEADYLKAADKTELSNAITAEANRADAAEKANAAAIKAISDDYLKAADKTELQGNIDGVAGRVATIEGDYLKGSDKTALEGKIDLKADQTALDAEVQAREGAISGLQTQINTIVNNPDTEGVINSINEFTKYIEEHGEIADGFRSDIDENAKAISDMDTAYKAADTALSGRLDVLEAIDHDAYVAADTALKNELDGDIAELAAAIEAAKTDASNKDAVVLAEAQKATAAVQTALNEAVDALEAADAGLAGRISTLEGKFTGEGSVEDMIADAKQEAIDSAVSTAAGDATQKANKALEDAKAYADAEDAKIESRVDALEAASSTHALASDLTALTGRVTTAEGEIDTLQSEMDAVEAKAAANETAIGTVNTELAKKAAQADLTAATDRITAIENWHSNFVEVSEEDINGLFA